VLTLQQPRARRPPDCTYTTAAKDTATSRLSLHYSSQGDTVVISHLLYFRVKWLHPDFIFSKIWRACGFRNCYYPCRIVPQMSIGQKPTGTLSIKTKYMFWLLAPDGGKPTAVFINRTNAFHHFHIGLLLSEAKFHPIFQHSEIWNSWKWHTRQHCKEVYINVCRTRKFRFLPLVWLEKIHFRWYCYKMSSSWRLKYAAIFIDFALPGLGAETSWPV
jgi:hypothetical protein